MAESNAGMTNVDQNNQLQVDENTDKNGGDPNQKAQPQQPAQIPDEVLYLMQQAKEEAKFELKQEIVEALNSEYQKFVEVDPVLATSLKGVAAAINGSVGNIVPLGENSQMNAMKEQQAQGTAQNMMQNVQGPAQPQTKKQASLPEFIWNCYEMRLKEAGYFENNAGQPQEKIASDLDEVFEVIVSGMNKYAELNGINLQDTSYWGVLKDCIDDGTFYQYGVENE